MVWGQWSWGPIVHIPFRLRLSGFESREATALYSRDYPVGLSGAILKKKSVSGVAAGWFKKV